MCLMCVSLAGQGLHRVGLYFSLLSQHLVSAWNGQAQGIANCQVIKGLAALTPWRLISGGLLNLACHWR